MFANDWETGTLAAWTSSVTDGGNLSAQAAAMHIGSYGLQALVNDNNDLYVQDDTPAAEKHYLTRFYVKPNSLTMASGDILDLFTGYSGTSSPVAAFRVQMQKTGNTYQVRVGLRNTAGTWTDSSWYDLNNRWNAVEVEWMASSTGSLGLWVNGESQQTINYVDNNSLAIDSVRLGAMGVDTGTRGTLSLDDFVSHRYTAVGLAYRSGQTNAAYTYADDDHVHAVTSVDRGASTDTYVYDANGNMTCRVENGDTYNQVYNAENRMAVAQLLRTGVDCPTANSLALTSDTLASWQFVYDGDGTRVKQVYTEYDENGDPTSTVATYLVAGGTYEVQVGAQTTVKLYYAIAGQVVGMSVRDTGTQEMVTLSYFLTDHLGSVVVVTDASGALVSEQRYLPFGQVREDVGNGIIQTDFGYTGQRALDAQNTAYTLGLMDYRARFYSSSLGRFSQPDSIVPNPANTQAWNRYSYVNNNPIRYNDPTGHDWFDPGDWTIPGSAWAAEVVEGVQNLSASILTSVQKIIKKKHNEIGMFIRSNEQKVRENIASAVGAAVSGVIAIQSIISSTERKVSNAVNSIINTLPDIGTSVKYGPFTLWTPQGVDITVRGDASMETNVSNTSIVLYPDQVSAGPITFSSSELTWDTSDRTSFVFGWNTENTTAAIGIAGSVDVGKYTFGWSTQYSFEARYDRWADGATVLVPIAAVLGVGYWLYAIWPTLSGVPVGAPLK